jgi:hypothetical protein
MNVIGHHDESVKFVVPQNSRIVADRIDDHVRDGGLRQIERAGPSLL